MLRAPDSAVRLRSSARGFTLVELMIVVTIVGILATIGLVALRRHVFGSRSVEALSMIQSIRAAQERWRAEHLTYMDASASGSFYPAGIPTSRLKRYFHGDGGHADAERWKLLNPTAPGPVEFGYMTNAGPPETAMTAPAVTVTDFSGWPTPTDHWYVIQAACDIDGDGTTALFLASSLHPEVYRQDEGE